MKKLNGVAASRGICIGPAFQFLRIELNTEKKDIIDTDAELIRLNDALNSAKNQIEAIYQKALVEAGEADAEIFQAHKMILDDPEFITAIRTRIENEKINSEFAVSETAKSFAATMAAIEDEYFAARATDIMDVANRVLRALMKIAESPTEGLHEPSIIVADDLTPSDTVLLDKSLVLGFCIAQGSATSHTAILARGLGLPAIAGVGDEIIKVLSGTKLIVDGTKGEVVIDPDTQTEQIYRQRLETSRNVQTEALKFAHDVAQTKDGVEFEIVANIGNVEDAKFAVENGAEGVGLLRTEFLYLERNSLPTEEEQYQAYKAILDVFGDRPVVLRTLDVGGDKEIPYLNLPKEMNPFLGERAIRLCLNRPDIFKPQLRAALRAGVGHNLKIMFPMVATLSDVRVAKAVVEECKAELTAESIAFARNAEIGIMVEIPSAAVVADQLAKEVDFFSIGTNDLSQYTMAADRTNPKVAELSDAFQPAVLRLIKMVIDAAHQEKKWVGMCGELAGEPLAAPILIGLGLDEFSMSPPFIPLVKQIIRNLDSQDMIALAQGALALESPKEIQQFVKKEIPFIGEIIS
ncbi:MAG TPA: phosphoenolpyruvate--protein phosphotransferase [Anaerolineaceae bacterium]|uniref:Phosphoenolpyruvate-protein phosphotransferase n=1 Tax=Anaerolinea thermophila TaxID=167964 RepID=A0A101FY25_9CHLR|nr:MAG: Phosphoenolpyruvate-protein phosphotransferase [Anaerolinea thermophila]HAF62661.1 phosphoenolpyruvate--protein phosphotransferase [Anaerolineaceae bacterium]